MHSHISSPNLAQSTMAIVPSPPRKPKLTTILSESRRLIKSQPRHFLALFFVLLFPLAISTVAWQDYNFFSTINGGNDRDHDDHEDQWMIATHLITLAYGIFSKVFSLFAVISITSVAFRSFHNHPIELKSVFKSISASFFPLLATSLLEYAAIVAISFAIGALFGSVLFGALLLGFQIDLSSPYFVRFSAIVVVVPLVLVATYLHVVWALVSAIVVAESTWGFAAMKRSASLVKGKRFLTLVLSLMFAAMFGVLGWTSNQSSYAGSKDDAKLVELGFLYVVHVTVFSSLNTMLKLYETVATTLLYVYCKAVHEEESFGDHYDKLLVDDDYDQAA